MRSRVPVGVLAFLGIGCALGFTPARAHACLCSGNPIIHSDPPDGATDTPLNFAPVIEGQFVPGSVTVENELGEVVDVTIDGGLAGSNCSAWAEIIPKRPWKPLATYTIRVTPDYPSTLQPATSTFVTGLDYLPDPPLTGPAARVSVLDLTDVYTCGGGETAFGCIHVDGRSGATPDIEMIALAESQVVLRKLLWTNEVGKRLPRVPDCVELKRRAPTGKRSKAVKYCAHDALRMIQWSPTYLDSFPWSCDESFFHGEENLIPDSPGDASVDASDSAEGEAAKHRRYGDCAATHAADGGMARGLAFVSAFIAFALRRRSRRPVDCPNAEVRRRVR